MRNGFQWFDAAADCPTISAEPEASGIFVMAAASQLLQIVLEHVSDHQGTFCGGHFPQPHLIGFERHVLSIRQQRPAAARDQAPCRVIGAQPIGPIDADTVDDLTVVIGRHVNMKSSLRGGPLRRCLFDVLHSVRTLVR